MLLWPGGSITWAATYVVGPLGTRGIDALMSARPVLPVMALTISGEPIVVGAARCPSSAQVCDVRNCTLKVVAGRGPKNAQDLVVEPTGAA